MLQRKGKQLKEIKKASVAEEKSRWRVIEMKLERKTGKSGKERRLVTLRPSFFDLSFTFIQSSTILTEHLLCARYCFSCWRKIGPLYSWRLHCCE